MNIVIWVFQGILAAMFAFAGANKTFTPMAKLAEKMPGIEKSPEALVRFIGISELLGAIGLLAPMLTHIMPVLTPIAAAALAVVMILAAITHIAKKEFKPVAFNVVLLALCVAVAYFRYTGV